MGATPITGIIALGALALLLVSAGIEDLRRREIANWKTLAIAGLAPAWWFATGVAPWPDLAIQIALALGVFAFFAAAFHFGLMGGGDVKLIGALALWLPFQPLAWMLIVMSIVGGGVTLLIAIEHRLRKASGEIQVPYGVAIAIAGLIAIREPLLNQISQCLGA